MQKGKMGTEKKKRRERGREGRKSGFLCDCSQTHPRTRSLSVSIRIFPMAPACQFHTAATDPATTKLCYFAIPMAPPVKFHLAITDLATTEALLPCNINDARQTHLAINDVVITEALIFCNPNGACQPMHLALANVAKAEAWSLCNPNGARQAPLL